jgi:hypothetical protein
MARGCLAFSNGKSHFTIPRHIVAEKIENCNINFAKNAKFTEKLKIVGFIAQKYAKNIAKLAKSLLFSLIRL